MKDKLIFAPLQKALKLRICTPVIASYNLISAIGELAESAKSQYGTKPQNIVPSLSGILEAVCVIANGAGYDIPDVKAALSLYGDDRSALSLRRGLQELTGSVYNLLRSPQQGAEAVNNITANILTICTAHDIDFQSVINYGIGQNKKK
ncbi:MAG TPA: hypothetical protein VMV77_05660 [Bacteroidales bacterium]|nr:hypothetical protein [Bacteroidales bacterium]